MFQDICLTCGRDVLDGRPYCNDDCQNGDLTSPSLSDPSSPFDSPHLAYAHGQDVPALVPSALGRALRAYTTLDRYSASSSSASSTSWSVVTDDDDDDLAAVNSEYDYDAPSRSATSQAGLSYARRPSGTNNPSTFSHLHRRTSSSSSSSLVCSLPQSAPTSRLAPPPDDDDDADVYSDLADPDDAPPHDPVRTITAKPHRTKRNRASLPAYFSMLQIAVSPVAAAALPPPYPRASPISSSSGHTLPARPSPPTPKLSLLAGLHTAPPSAAFPHHTPRGRRRVPSHAHSPPAHHSRSRTPSSVSASGSRERRTRDEKVFDWSSALARERGRAVRRNSSPPPPVMLRASAELRLASASPRLSPRDVYPSPHMYASPPVHLRSSRRGSGSGSRARTRGRARVEELDGAGSPERPGYGAGRSGLIGRAQRGGGEDWGLHLHA
ncbi:hypothetical protein B0H10DRAFT_1981658 [Mycena sp. CBHHK59/15]|nr:hypothetical protein B0H10DRAFT_1981658 [Mycena sp. CBHHK59/15]